ncbi:MAG: host attachment protein [Alphaproteobacteria bacterium]|nr:host attachment protein [Alphaproteobacteria bacterium]
MSSYPEYSGFHQVTSVIWALVSDGKTAYAFKYIKKETVLASRFAWGISVYGKDRKNEQNARQQAQNSVGYSPAPNNVIQVSFENRSSAKERFAATISAKLQQAFDDSAFDYLVVVAPRDSMSALKQALGNDLRSRLLENMPEGYLYDKKGVLFVVRTETPSGLGLKEASSRRNHGSLLQKTRFSGMGAVNFGQAIGSYAENS